MRRLATALMVAATVVVVLVVAPSAAAVTPLRHVMAARTQHVLNRR